LLRERPNKPHEESPHKEPESLTNKEKNRSPQGLSLVETEGESDDIPYNRHPRNEREPNSEFVYLGFLLLEGFGLHFEPLFDPFPLAYPSHSEGNHATEPVAQSGHNKAGDRFPAHRKCSYVERIGAERDNGCGKQVAKEKTEQAEAFKIKHK